MISLIDSNKLIQIQIRFFVILPRMTRLNFTADKGDTLPFSLSQTSLPSEASTNTIVWGAIDTVQH